SPTLLIFRSEGQRSIADADGARANTGAVHHRSLPAQYQVSRAVQVAKALYRADHGDHSDHAVHYGCRKRPNESTTTMPRTRSAAAHGMRNEIAKLGKKRGKLDKSKEMCLLVEKEVHVSVS